MSDNEEPSIALRLFAADRQEIMQMITQFLDECEARQQQRSSQPASPQPQSASPDYNTHVKASEIGFFFPNMPYEWGDPDIVDRDGKNY